MPEVPGGWVPERRLPSSAAHVVFRSRRPGQGPVVIKASAPAAGRSSRTALRREARLLDRAPQGDGVVALLDVLDRRGRTALVLGLVPAGSLESRPSADPEAAIGAVEATVGRLHRLGLVHGALVPEHVVLDADGAPVLVGFGHARRSTDLTADLEPLAALTTTIRSGA